MQNERALRFAVLGTNTISDRFAEAVGESNGACISAVVSRTQSSAAAFADRHGIPHRYTDPDAMLSDGVADAVYVATPNFCHADMSIAALRAGHHVLCEKPVALTHAEWARMRAAAERAGCVLLEAMRPDFDPAYAVLRAALPTIGTIRRAAFTYCQYSSRYDAFLRGEVLRAFDPSIQNCALADIGIYPLHLLLSLFGAPRAIHSGSVFLSNGFEGAGSILLDYADRGFCATVSYSKVADNVDPSVIEGERGSITIDKINAPTRLVRIGRDGESEVLYTCAPYNNMRCEVDFFVRAVREKFDTSPYLSVTDLTMRCYDRIVIQNRIFQEKG